MNENRKSARDTKVKIECGLDNRTYAQVKSNLRMKEYLEVR